jgi:hypothetical protein
LAAPPLLVISGAGSETKNTLAHPKVRLARFGFVMRIGALWGVLPYLISLGFSALLAPLFRLSSYGAFQAVWGQS